MEKQQKFQNISLTTKKKNYSTNTTQKKENLLNTTPKLQIH